jgi:uncharacterized protein
MNTVKQVKWYCVVAYLFIGLGLMAAEAVASVEGDWDGKLVVGSETIPLVIHLSNSQGKWQGTLDSPAQGGFDIPMSQVIFKDNHLMFELEKMGIHYEGTYDAANDSIQGTFIQGASLTLDFKRAVKQKYEAHMEQETLLGVWSGVIETPMSPLSFVIHVALKDGKLVATADSPDQGATGIPIEKVNIKDGEVTFKMESIGASYTARFLIGKDVLDGQFKQGPAVLPLTMDKKPLETKQANRPQTPKAPFAYDVEEVVVHNAKANIDLAGSLTLPKDRKIRAAAILITGSGGQDRDETLFGHKPFLVIADHLTKQGYAVLRMDDRGMGGSGGSMETSTSADFVTDIEAAMNFLQKRADMPKNKIGLIGHSEGGMIAPMLAAQRNDVAFVIMMAGPGIKIVDLYTQQRELVFSTMGLPAESVSQITRLDRIAFDKINQLPLGAGPDESLLKIGQRIFASAGAPDEETQTKQAKELMKAWTSTWFRYFLQFDPEPFLAETKAPILAINGELDIQVTAKENLAGIKETLANNSHPDFETKAYPQLNHLFQPAKTGAITEYAKIEQTIAPIVLEDIAKWLNKRFKAN